jgi:hypothetical protein
MVVEHADVELFNAVLQANMSLIFAALTAGTNAEPKSPASKPAVVTAVTSLFLMN